MERLDFVLPEWTRRIWASDEAREVWEPRIQEATRAWQKIEQLSVEAGVRDSCLVTVTPEELPFSIRWAARRDLLLLPLGRQAAGNSYQSGPPGPVQAGGSWVYRATLTQPRLVEEWDEAWRSGDNDHIGRLLSYPACCRHFFERVWVEGQHVDTSWAMAADLADGGVCADVRDAYPESNILLRWLGIRAVSHLPCSFTCEATRVLGERFLGLAPPSMKAAVGWLREMLAWPVEWSALHGIAEIKTPVVKVSTRTDATPYKYTVRVHSDAYPEEGASGTVFPYQSRRERKPKLVQIQTATDWTDNGFSSKEAMEQAHAVLVQALPVAYPENGARICDLGAGNGALLARVREGAPDGSRLVGIELDPQRAQRAVDGVEVRVGNFLKDTDTWAAGGTWDLVIVMPGRFMEVDSETAERTRQLLSERADQILLYAYGDWLEQHGSLAALAEVCGFTVQDPIEESGVAAGLGSVAHEASVR